MWSSTLKLMLKRTWEYISRSHWYYNTITKPPEGKMHLKEDMRLSYLAQELISTDRLDLNHVRVKWSFSLVHTFYIHSNKETDLTYVALEDFENGIKIQLINGVGTWESSLDKDGAFKVCDLRWKVDDQSGITQSIPIIKWSKEVLIKINFFLCRAIQHRIASMMGLRARGIESQTTMCGACINEEEDVDHVLVRCPFAKDVRDKIFNWCGIQNQSFNSISELLIFAAN
uniref:Reverse transcriptase zinc-binding domain-containing protein n=1 Tax=Lactuca sativa TaxID=4236 RepID=A0A9R1UUH0_LACSA|nr:hypothetical protein LSAT_V11C800398890 [Lactuca sativa]